MQPDETVNDDQQQPFQPAAQNPSTTGNTTDPVVQSANGTDLPVDHPSTDTGIDSTEVYDEGTSGAAEVEDLSSQSAVTNYTTDDDDKDDEIANQAL